MKPWEEQYEKPVARIEINGTAADEQKPWTQEYEKKPKSGGAASFGMGIVRGGKDLIDSGAYLIPKGLSYATSLGGNAPNAVSEYFGSEAKKVSDQNKQGEQDFQSEYGGGWGTAGRVVGNIATAFIPGTGQAQLANKAGALWQAGGVVNKLRSFVPAAALGAGQGVALNTRTEDDSVAKNAAVGAAGGMAGQLVGGKISDIVKNRAAAKVTNAARDTAAKAGRDAGYVFPPSQTNPTFVNRLLEGIAGKANVQQSASVRNNEVTQRLVAQNLGTTPDQLTPEGLKAIRKQAGQAYANIGNVTTPVPVDAAFQQQVGKIGANTQNVGQQFSTLQNPKLDELNQSLSQATQYDPATLLEAIKLFRSRSTAHMSNTTDDAIKELGRGEREAGRALEDLIERAFQSTNPELVPKMQEARKLIAKTYSAEKALTAPGQVSATKLGQQLTRGKPLSGELETVAKIGQQFPKAVQDVRGISEQILSPLDVHSSAAMSLAGTVAGGPAGWLAGGIPILRPIVRNTLLSKPYQSMAGSPSYASSAMMRALGSPGAPPVLQQTLTPGLSALLNQ